MKKHTEAFKEAKRNSRILTHTTKSLPLIKDVLITIAMATFCALAIYFLAVPANAHDIEPTLSLNFSGDSIRAQYFQDDSINFAEDFSIFQIFSLFNGTPKTINAQTLIFLEDNAVMNYAQDEPIHIIELAQVIAQQITNELNYEPDALTFIILDSSLAIVYKGNLWTSEDYFIEAQLAIDRQSAIWEEERTNEQMRPEREEEQYSY